LGCGGGERVAAEPAPPPQDEQEDAASIELGQIEGSLKGHWTMEAQKSSVRIEGEERTTAQVRAVQGQLLKGESVESRFVADSGEANTSTGRLTLSGKVRITSEKDEIYLTADKVTYDEKLALVIAEGNVKVNSSAWTSGPYDRLVATPGLERVGTPDRFGL
jgi:lipopolysaccharide assembly outer membrane protein LptD (OstA)